MENLKKQIIKLFWEHSIEAHSKGSCGELGDSFQVIDSSDYSDLADKIFDLIDPKRNKKYTFNKAVEPAIRYLLKNHNPNTKIYIDYSGAELLEGQITHNLNNEIPD